MKQRCSFCYCLIITFVVMSSCAISTAQAQPIGQTKDEEEFISWVKTNAVRVDALDWTAFNNRNLSFLDRALEGKRVVYLGEPDHYIHEKYDYRLILIRYLFEKGWRHIGSEIGRSDGHRIDEFIATGDTAYLDRVATYGYRGALRTDRNDFTAGIASIALAKRDVWKDTVLPEERWFAQQLRNLSASQQPGSPRIQFFGFDVDVMPGGGYEDIQSLLNPYSDSKVVHLRRLLKRVEGESIDEEIARLNRALRYIDVNTGSLQRLLGKSTCAELRNSLLCLRDSFKFMRIKGSDRPASVNTQAMIDREQTMCHQMREKISLLRSDEKIILLGHNTHLSKDYTTLRFGRLNTNSAAWPTVGTCVQDLLPNQVYSIWMLYDHGSHSDLFCAQESCRVESNADRIESLFSRVGVSAFLLPLLSSPGRSRFLDESRNFICNGCDGGYGSGILPRQADAIFFVDEVTSMRRRR